MKTEAEWKKQIAIDWSKRIDGLVEDALRGGATTAVAPEDAPTLTVRKLLQTTLSAFTGFDVKVVNNFPNDTFAYCLDPADLPFPSLDPNAKKLLVIGEDNAIKLQGKYLSNPTTTSLEAQEQTNEQS